MIIQLIKESFRFAWQALVVNKLRTILSLLGVTIGIFSIIFVLSIVDSMEAEMKAGFDMIGSDVLFVQKWPMGPDEGDDEYEWWNYMSRRQPTLKDMEELKDRMKSIESIAFSAGDQKTAQYANNYIEAVDVMGMTYEYKDVIAVKIAEGRYFTPIECETGKNFGIIGFNVRDQLFGSGMAIGKEITVGGQKIVVIGVCEKEGASLFGNGFDQAVLMPIEFGTRMINLKEQDANIILKAKDGIDNKELKSEVLGTFREIRRIKPKGDNDFSIIESSMISGMVDDIVGVFNIVGMIIGIFSILVGAFSIANIMFVSVSERTGVIGIQKALGARNSFILNQFLFESVALCLIGGAIGLFLVWMLMKLLGQLVEFTFLLPFARIVMGLSISVVVGIVAGIVPAMKAARLNPVDAMRSK